jgi:tRNA1(Val) A37 N6-methylase TrmN6
MDDEKIKYIEEYKKWIDSFPEYIKPNEGKLSVIRKPEDINDIFEELGGWDR